MRSLAFSGYYWLACCVFVGAALAPRVVARIGGRAFAGRRGRFVRATCIALAAMWFCASLVLAISARCLGAADAYAAASSLHGIWKVTSIGSMVACAVHMYLRAAYDRSVDAPSHALLVVLLTCSVCIGFLRAPAFSALTLGAAPMGYMQEMVSPLFAPIMFVPLGIIGAFLQRSSRVVGARGLFACAWGLCAGEITARICIRYLPDQFFWIIDNPSSPWGWQPRRSPSLFLCRLCFQTPRCVSLPIPRRKFWKMMASPLLAACHLTTPGGCRSASSRRLGF